MKKLALLSLAIIAYTQCEKYSEPTILPLPIRTIRINHNSSVDTSRLPAFYMRTVDALSPDYSLTDLILELSKDYNRTFIIATHNSDIAERSDRVLYLDDGKIIA